MLCERHWVVTGLPSVVAVTSFDDNDVSVRDITTKSKVLTLIGVWFSGLGENMKDILETSGKFLYD